MSFNWTTYLVLARELAGHSAPRRQRSAAYEQARLRSAISRAYYAAFCRARNHLRDNEGLSPPRSADVHQWVVNQFLNSPNQVHIGVAQDLNRLRRQRNIADYDDTVTGLPNLARAALRLAERVLTGLDNL